MDFQFAAQRFEVTRAGSWSEFSKRLQPCRNDVAIVRVAVYREDKKPIILAKLLAITYWAIVCIEDGNDIHNEGAYMIRSQVLCAPTIGTCIHEIM